MPVINVVKAFTFTTDDAIKMHYAVGEYDVDDAIADHWFVQAHLAGFVEPMPQQGSTQYAQAMLNAEQSVRRAQPMAPSNQPLAPLTPDVVMVASRTGAVPEGAHYFAGLPQEDKPMPGTENNEPGISFMRSGPGPHQEA